MLYIVLCSSFEEITTLLHRQLKCTLVKIHVLFGWEVWKWTVIHVIVVHSSPQVTKQLSLFRQLRICAHNCMINLIINRRFRSYLTLHYYWNIIRLNLWVLITDSTDYKIIHPFSCSQTNNPWWSDGGLLYDQMLWYCLHQTEYVDNISQDLYRNAFLRYKPIKYMHALIHYLDGFSKAGKNRQFEVRERGWKKNKMYLLEIHLIYLFFYLFDLISSKFPTTMLIITFQWFIKLISYTFE